MSKAADETVVNLTTEEVLEEGKKGVHIIDVREQVEIHNTGLIPGAVNIPLGHLEEAMGMSPADFKERYGFEKPSAYDRLIMSCQSGNRSRRATIAMKKLGFTDLSWTVFLAYRIAPLAMF
ncbi:unnamed protein product [Nesidiocoris tenuis]|uniref:Rhodanese domain-containing protein n=1 Tax=Nesidiocoris tenuis TaxID=355587 RepID=A0A6H5HSC0_9HEMI|nr:unnamed protein product [Nesidiocoris tenuis]